MNIRTVKVTRYVTPLREGGSLPAIVEAEDDGLYVLKFRGAGQGVRALIAELVAGEIGRALGMKVPEIVFVELDSTRYPTGTLPVNVIFRTRASWHNASPNSPPGPVTHDTASGGIPASSNTSANFNADSGVTVGGFITIAFPAAMAGPRRPRSVCAGSRRHWCARWPPSTTSI